MTRCLLHEKEFPKKLKAEVANIVVLWLNRLPTRVLNKKKTHETWFSYKPNLQNLRTFGCLCFSYVPLVERDKLDKNTEPRIFIRYSDSCKACRNFQP